MENIVKAIYIPENITQAGHAHCKEYLDMALGHMIMNTSASAQSVTEDTSTTDTERLREATTQTNAKYVQLRQDIGQLATSVMARV